MSFPAPTDIVPGRPDAAKFALRSVSWSLAFFGLLRLGWMESHLVLPLTRLQGAVAMAAAGAPAVPVEVTLACSGADALALCIGAVLAYPVRWRTSLLGAAGGVSVILVLNTIRIGTLGRAASSPVWFDALHLYIWPALLMLAIAGYVFVWMSAADQRQRVADISMAPQTAAPPSRPHPSRRFVWLTIAFVLGFGVSSPFYLESPNVLALGGFIARATAAMLTAAGAGAFASSNMLWTPRGAFLVTQECLSTPLIPIYLAFVCAYSRSSVHLVVGFLATLPLFTVLGITRLLVVALPAAIMPSPLFFVHAFYQFLLGAVIVFMVAAWRHGGRAAPRHAFLGVLTAIAFIALFGPSYTRAIAFQPSPLDDSQGAIALLPAFQIALYLGLWVAASVTAGWTRFLAGLAALSVTQTAGLLALHILSSYSGFSAHVRDIRGWAVAGPVLVFALVICSARPAR